MTSPTVSPTLDPTSYLAGQHAIITGGGRGIGAAIATALAQHGARITLMSRHEATVSAHAAYLRQHYNVDAVSIPCDVSRPDSVAQAFTSASNVHGLPYVLVNNAGQGASDAFDQTTLDTWERMLSVNLTGTFLCTQQVLPAMLTARSGRIINIASTAGLKGYSHTAAYCASKHGVVGLTRSLAVETAKHGITVNAVCPGYTETGVATQAIKNLMTARNISEDDARRMLIRGIPRGRLTQPEEVANAVAWLCSPLADAITGQSIAVAGGEVM